MANLSRSIIAILIVCLGLGLTLMASLTQGAIPLGLTELQQALWHQGSSINQTVVWDLRLPRIVAALMVGSALGLSGALLQGMLRNGLADPFILGISAGAGLVAVAFLTLGFLQSWVPLAAWLGAIITTGIVYLLARNPSGISVERLLLGGVAISSLFGALQSMLLLLSDDGRIQAALNWLIGSLNGRGWNELIIAGPYLAISLLVGCTLARVMNLLQLGDDLAVSLGVSLWRSRLLIGAIAALLAASAVSIAGLVGFVGLIVPHGARLLVGTDYRWVLPLSILGGAWILLLADLLSRLGAIELPVGIVTALLGSPVFVWLLYRRSYQS
ncbi:MAG: iron ABC transporter permease [Symploca sp. SIO3C6]|uniref:Iron ABC transporter permease n=1 Tax=Symploca sp. SIO1C4 TaxID=2607765 RepID=A0A6B3NFS5_9CYAN|nr:iron ABC transporter permease [Symploca sp. SIO3C6]NER30510.1 iron ABC transporter permease [Symploca sp. SIO1C4]NET07436.1 iron ABC transporter permease [Symploca sp. SIO2B6]NET51525.1 iron ABC transporter permease [Merismopedia sp. SIO2A8]